MPPISTSSRKPAVAESPPPPVAQWQASTQPAEEPEDARRPVATREEICNSVASAAQAHDLPIAFLASLVWQESRFNWQAVSPVGAVGIAQFMPEVGKAFGLSDPFDPLQAIHVSAKVLRELHEQFGNLGLAAAAYNAGPKRVLDWMASRGNLPAETRTYVLAITGRPAEQWVTKIDNTAFKIPARTPCQSFANLLEWSLAGTGQLKPDLPDVAAVPLPPKKPMIAISRNKVMGAKRGEQPTKVTTGQPMWIVAANLRGKAAAKTGPVPAQHTAAR
jgi:soluble lytic murein transglycosylase-like protein